MFRDVAQFKKIYIACGRTDLRYGVDGLADLVQTTFKLDPFDEGTLFLFCGTKSDRIKGLLWEGLSAGFCYPHIFKLSTISVKHSQNNVRIKFTSVRRVLPFLLRHLAILEYHFVLRAHLFLFSLLLFFVPMTGRRNDP